MNSLLSESLKILAMLSFMLLLCFDSYRIAATGEDGSFFEVFRGGFEQEEKAPTESELRFQLYMEAQSMLINEEDSNKLNEE